MNQYKWIATILLVCGTIGFVFILGWIVWRLLMLILVIAGMVVVLVIVSLGAAMLAAIVLTPFYLAWEYLKDKIKKT